MSVGSIRSSWLGDGVTRLTRRESGENTSIGLMGHSSRMLDFNASLSLTVVNCPLVCLMPAQRESCGDAHIGPMVSEVNRSFLTGLTGADGSTGAAPVTRLNQQPAGSARSPAAADDIGSLPRRVPVPLPLPNTAAQTGEGRVGETARPGWNGAAREPSQRRIGGRANRMVARC